MSYDHIVIGSGLSALATTLGLIERGQRVLVIAGSDRGFRRYPGSNVPAAYGGRGGLGEYWHGVIPLSLHHRPAGADDASWRGLADHFYPGVSLGARLGRQEYFVPRRPIRPAYHFADLASRGKVELVDGDVQTVEPRNGEGQLQAVETTSGHHSARHLWLCAGALETPAILARSGLIAGGPRFVSDHVIGYAGQISAGPETDLLAAGVQRTADGVFFPFRFADGNDHFFTVRPARFDFATLDAGISKRAVFGLPTNRIVSGLAGNMSPGLISEALFNKFGLFPRAAKYSVYFQTAAPEAYVLYETGVLEPATTGAVTRAIMAACADVPFPGIEPTRQSALYIPGIHLHGSLTPDESERFGRGRDMRNIHLVDAASLRDIGPEHHSFVMMAAAYGRAAMVASEE